MNKYRKLPVEIEAIQFNGNNYADIEKWANESGTKRNIRAWGVCMRIETLEGAMNASPGDWIIKGVGGEFYPCKDEIFKATYEPVEAASDCSQLEGRER